MMLTRILMLGTQSVRPRVLLRIGETPVDSAIPGPAFGRAPPRACVFSQRSDDNPQGHQPAPAAPPAPPSVGTWGGMETCIGVAMRPIGPRVVSNAITPRPTANLDRRPSLSCLACQSWRPITQRRFLMGLLTFRGGMANTADICALSIHGRIPPAPAGQRSKVDSQKYLRAPGVGSCQRTRP